MPPKYPSRVDRITFPVFGLAWWADPSNGRSICAYVGGGGSSRTGIQNIVTIQDGEEDPVHVSTGDRAGDVCRIGHNHMTGKLWLFVNFGTEVHRFHLPSGELDSVLQLELAEKERATAMAINSTVTLLAVGLESGTVKVYHMPDDNFAGARCIDVVDNHQMAVSGIDFSARGGRLITSSKDGTACVYQEGQIISGFLCSIDDPSVRAPVKPKGGKAPRVLVRACAFLDLDGRIAVTVASGVRGKSFLSRWQQHEEAFECVDRLAVAPNPISSLNLSMDGTWLALGSSIGSVILWNVHDWKLLHQWPEVHDFPTTALACRPFPGVQLQGESNGLQIHVRTASGDSSLGYLTLMRRIPKKAKAYGSQSSSTSSIVRVLLYGINRMLQIVIVAWILSPIVKEAFVKCASQEGWGSKWKCVVDEVLIAPPGRPGVSVPPY